MAPEFREEERTADTKCQEGGEATDAEEDEEEGRQQFTPSIEDVACLMRPTHCLVYYTAQGRTLRDKNVLLLDVDARRFTLRHFIVGVSRATTGSRLNIATSKQQAELMRRETAVVKPNPVRLHFGEHDFSE